MNDIPKTRGQAPQLFNGDEDPIKTFVEEDEEGKTTVLDDLELLEMIVGCSNNKHKFPERAGIECFEYL